MENVEFNEAPKGTATSIPLIYANSLMVATSLTDVSLTALYNNRPASQMVMPYSVAKSLIPMLEKAIKNYETKTHSDIIDMDALSSFLNK